MPLIALTRPVPDSLARCELTHLTRVPIDPAAARRQHDAYEDALRSLGCDVRRLPAAHLQPDSVFVEDTAVVLDEVAVLARPGAASRRGEIEAIGEALRRHRPLQVLTAPATLDGGDVLRLGRTLFVGIGGRTNEAAVAQLTDAVGPFEYAVRPVPVEGCLHLKSAVTEAAPGVVLVNPASVDAVFFEPYTAIEVDPAEPAAANVLGIGSMVICASAHERTNARLESAGLRLLRLDMSELAKAEAGVTCCSLIFHG